MVPAPTRHRGLLEEVEIFRSLGPADRQQIERHARLHAVRAREFLYVESTPARSVFVVARGRIRTCRSEASGRVTTLEEFSSGDLFGLAAILRADTYAEAAQALTDGEVLAIAAPAFLEVMGKDPRLVGNMLALVALRLQRAHERLCSFARGSVPARVAQAVLERDAGGRIEVTRQTLSEAAGTTVETTIRVLRRFERAGWIESGTGWVIARDTAALRRVAEGAPLPPSARD